MFNFIPFVKRQLLFFIGYFTVLNKFHPQSTSITTCLSCLAEPHEIMKDYGGEKVDMIWNGPKYKCTPGKGCGHYTAVRLFIYPICILYVYME